MVSWGEGDQDGAHRLQLVLCPQLGAASGCGGGRAKPRAVCSGRCEPELSARLLPSPWLPGGSWHHLPLWGLQVFVRH